MAQPLEARELRTMYYVFDFLLGNFHLNVITTTTKMQRVFMYFDHFQKHQRRRNRGYVSAKRNLPFDKKIRDSSVLQTLRSICLEFHITSIDHYT